MKKKNQLAGGGGRRDLHRCIEDDEVGDGCFPPGCKKKRLCRQKWVKNKATVFQIFNFSAIYKRSSEFWKKVNFSGREPNWASTLVARCRVTLQARRTSKTICSPKIDVHAQLSKRVHRCMLHKASDSLRAGLRRNVGVCAQVSNC